MDGCEFEFSLWHKIILKEKKVCFVKKLKHRYNKMNLRST